MDIRDARTGATIPSPQRRRKPEMSALNSSNRLPLAHAFILAALCAASTMATAQNVKDRNIKFPVVNEMDHPQGIGAKKFGELVEAKSGGKMKVKVFPGGTLGGEQQVASAMQGGTVE